MFYQVLVVIKICLPHRPNIASKGVAQMLIERVAPSPSGLLRNISNPTAALVD